ncbi:MAG TPA: hypothetical protein VFN65_05595 [Solirubrobacteraceae bacterium]|nr:hypothetical protein [Solirubrobacteraceae bacterium]
MIHSDPHELTARLRALPDASPALAVIAAGDEAVYLVGGAVRDLALGRAPLDLDLVVEGDPRGLAERLSGDGGPVRAHGRFGTATARSAHGVRYDIAAARTETYPHPGALPEVAAAGIGEDLARRDFTVNALALALSGPDRGRLLSAPHGIEDLRTGRLRVLHERSFRDDPTRLLRLARYAVRLGFTIEPHTEALARAATADGAVATVSGARIGAELRLLCSEPDPVAGFTVLRSLGADAAIAPAFGLHDPGAARRALATAAEVPAVQILVAAALLGVPEADRRGLLDRLGFDRHTRREVLAAAAHAPELGRRAPADGPPSRLLAALPVDEPATIALAAGLAPPATGAALERWLAAGSRVRLQIDGGDLIAAGVPRGPAISVALRAALGARLDGMATTREQQLATALAAVRGADSLGA